MFLFKIQLKRIYSIFYVNIGIQGGFELNEYMVLPFLHPRHQVLNALYSLAHFFIVEVISEGIYDSAIF